MDINLASLIDVVFILLLFFVVTTTFTRETQLRVELPEAVSGASADDQTRQLDIAISADGVFSVNNHVLPKSDLATLIEALQKESNGDTSLPLSISADGKTQHQSVITAMDAAGKLGFSQLRMTTVEAAPTAP
ncbi:biopolymer transport protein ExbD [compost metagenome]